MIRIAAIGLGNRACKYLEYMGRETEEVRLVAVAEPNVHRRARVAAAFDLEEENVFASAEELFDSDIAIDAVIIASPDDTHYPFALRSLEKGWHILLEKPAASNYAECREIGKLARKKGLSVFVCYVLRFHPLYLKMKELTHSDGIGRIVSIHHIINVGLDRMAHTFVRGLWSIGDDSSPIVLSKASHDIDILCWLIEDKAVQVRSSGSLDLYRIGNAPENSAERCIDCPLEKECRFSAVDLYLRRDGWNKGFDVLPHETKKDAILRELSDGRYGRCVYRCDNDVLDNQTVEMLMENGTIVSMEMEGRSDKDSRETTINCENGIISTDGSIIRLRRSDTGETKEYDMSEYMDMPLHGGADIEIVEDFIKTISGKGDGRGADISSAIHSHHICFLAEESRAAGTSVPVIEK